MKEYFLFQQDSKIAAFGFWNGLIRLIHVRTGNVLGSLKVGYQCSLVGFIYVI